MHVLVPLTVLLPLLGAAVALAAGRTRKVQVTTSVTTLSLTTVVTGMLLYLVDRDGPVVVEVGSWPAPQGIVLSVDRMSSIMLVVSYVVLLGVLIYSVGQGIADGNRETPLTIFHPTYMILAAGLSVAFVTGDLFNLYVGFEMLLA